MSSVLVGLHLKSTLTSKLFPVSRNCFTLKGQSLQDQQGPKEAKHQNIENRRCGGYMALETFAPGK